MLLFDISSSWGKQIVDEDKLICMKKSLLIKTCGEVKFHHFVNLTN